MSESNGHPVQSLGMRIVGRVFKEVEGKPTVEMALKAAPILAEALKHSPYNLNNQRYKAMVYSIMGKRNKAINIYRHLLRTRHKSVLYKELSVLVVEQSLKNSSANTCHSNTTRRKVPPTYALSACEICYLIPTNRMQSMK